MSLSSDIRDIEDTRQYYIEYRDVRSMLYTSFFANYVDDYPNTRYLNSDNKGGIVASILRMNYFF